VAEVRLVDVSIRDGNQSLWGAVGVSTRQILQVAPLMDRVGFAALDYSSSTAMGVAVRTHREDPWERLRRTKALMPDTHLQFIGTGMRFISWQTAHPEVMQLVYDRLVAGGMTRFIVLDPTHDLDAMLVTAAQLRRAGAEQVVAALTFTLSPMHDDAFYAGLAGALAACPDVDRLYVKDPTGLLSPERARTLIPAVLAALPLLPRVLPRDHARSRHLERHPGTHSGASVHDHAPRGEEGVGKPLELHSHATLGLSQLTYPVMPDLGVRTLHVACGPLSDGSSLPDAERTVANLRELGHTVDVDDRLLALVADYFTRLAAAQGLPSGTTQPYDASYLRHQLAGGVLTTTRRQLAELGLEHRFGEVIEEVDRVRAELGYPIMVTPFPQIVCSQALANVIGPQRYATLSDQVIRYLLGSFGRPTMPVAPDVADRILGSPRAAQLRAEPPPPDVAELRARFGRRIGEEELLLRASMPAGEVDAMLAAGPSRDGYTAELVGVRAVVAALAERPGVRQLSVRTPDLTLELARDDAVG
jgi:oxaloacetate decarboxylase (Na+ extruding) subunit alpha